MARTSQRELIHQITQEGAPVPGGFRFDPRADEVLAKIDETTVAKKLQKEVKEDGEEGEG